MENYINYKYSSIKPSLGTILENIWGVFQRKMHPTLSSVGPALSFLLSPGCCDNLSPVSAISAFES